MEFSRHARNRMRLYGLTIAEVEASIRAPREVERDDQGNALLVGTVGGRRLMTVLAADRPGYVITLWEET